jgi:anti-sigma factor RsiW
MSCEETKQSLSLYVDDALMLPARVAVDEHLNKCPVCRDEVVELRALTRGLSMLARPLPPADLAASINDALAIEVAALRQSPKSSFAERLARFLEPRLMPYSVGSVASVVLFIMVFAGLRPHVVALHEAAAQSSAAYVVPASAVYDLSKPVRSEDYAASRAPFAEQSPSLNPRGALAKLTQSYAQPHTSRSQDADDMLVVADVFSNGAASLVDVVHAPRNRKMLNDFQVALRSDAAFVPASMDRRPDTMRVVFAVQKVDVRERNF